MSDAQSLIEQHGDAVWRTVYRLLSDPEDARDCYQDTFLAALRLAERETVRNWSAMLRRLATCRALDRLRQRYRRREHGAELDHFTGSDRFGGDPSARLEAMEIQQQVRDALAELPDRQAEAFWLRHMEQLSPNEIAEQLGVSVPNARQLVHRAIAALRKHLSPEFNVSTPQALTGEQR